MSSERAVAYIDIRTTAHATEDADKVLKALRSVLPAELAETAVFERTSLTGHHGNPITLFQAHVKDRRAATAVFEKLSSGLPIMDKEFLSREIQQHIERGNLYLRLEKQLAYMNELKLCQSDPIHLRIHFRRHKTTEVVEICREFGLIP